MCHVIRLLNAYLFITEAGWTYVGVNATAASYTNTARGLEAPIAVKHFWCIIVKLHTPSLQWIVTVYKRKCGLRFFPNGITPGNIRECPSPFPELTPNCRHSNFCTTVHRVWLLFNRTNHYPVLRIPVYRFSHHRIIIMHSISFHFLNSYRLYITDAQLYFSICC